MARYFRLEKLVNLEDGYCRVFQVDAHNMMLLQIEGERYLIESRCPHRDFPLAQADLIGTTLTCSQHHYRFDVATGKLMYATEEPCRNLKRYELIVQDKDVGVML